MVASGQAETDGFGWQIGCLPCLDTLDVTATNGGYDELAQLLGGVVPIKPAGTSGTERASCGLKAFNGCPNAETINMLKELINSEAVEGVRLV